jgi:hypothetical protein
MSILEVETPRPPDEPEPSPPVPPTIPEPEEPEPGGLGEETMKNDGHRFQWRYLGLGRFEIGI